MTDAKKVIVNRMIEQNLEQYDGFFDHNWARALIDSVHPRLRDAAGSLCLAWKEASNTHRLPWLMVHQMKEYAEGYMKGHKSQTAKVVELFTEWVLRELNGALKRAEKRAVLSCLKTISQRLRIAEDQPDAKFPVMKYWEEIAQQSEFQLSISGSQNLTYCGLVFAYEWFVVQCFRVLGGDEEERPGGKKFWPEFKKLMGRDMKPDYWDDKAVWIAREARNCIAHLGGKAKPELKAENPTLWISPEEGIISVRPSDNRELFTILKGKVARLVGEVTPKL
jgi:hypothetical protein